MIASKLFIQMSILALSAIMLTACAITTLNREELRDGITKGTLPPIGIDSVVLERGTFFTTRKVLLRDRIDELRRDCGEQVLKAVRSKQGFPAGGTISRTYVDHASLELLGEEEAASIGRVRYRISANGGRGATFGPCANMRELLLIDGKPVVDGPYQYCQPLKRN